MLDKVKLFPEESLPELPQGIVARNYDADNLIFDPKSCFAKNGDFMIPEEVKNSRFVYLVYILEPRRLNKVTLQAIADSMTGKCYGGWEDKEKKILKKMTITKVTTLIDLEKKTDIEKFQLICANPFVLGSRYQGDSVYFRIEIPELSAQQELSKFEHVEDAITYISSLNEEELSDLAIAMGVTSFRNLSPVERKTFMRKLAINNPNKILEVKNNKDLNFIVNLEKAVALGIVVNKKGVYKFADEELGISVEQAVNWAKSNPEIWAMIEEQIKTKQNKSSQKDKG